MRRKTKRALTVANNNASSEDVAAFTAHIEQCPVFEDAMQTIARHEIPNCYISGTGIAQTYWNVVHGRPYLEKLSDIDVVYFDATDLGIAREKEFERGLNNALSAFPVQIDVKNQARVHLWYAEKFGYEISPYTSIEDAIRTFPTTSATVGIRKPPTGNNEGWDVFAPFGLADILALQIRPNKIQITHAIYQNKAQSYKKRWPLLEILPW